MPFTESVPTQQAHPWRAVARTVLAVLVGLGLVVPLVVQALTDQLGVYIPDRAKAWLIAASAFTIALSGAVTRIIAIPAVDAWLRRLGLSSTPAPTRPANVAPALPFSSGDPVIVTYHQRQATPDAGPSAARGTIGEIYVGSAGLDTGYEVRFPDGSTGLFVADEIEHDTTPDDDGPKHTA